MKTLRNFMLGALSTGDCYWCFEGYLAFIVSPSAHSVDS